jgi:hypothetical protein
MQRIPIYIKICAEQTPFKKENMLTVSEKCCSTEVKFILES